MMYSIQPTDLYPGAVAVRLSDDVPGYWYAEFLLADDTVLLKVSVATGDDVLGRLGVAAVS